MSNVRLSPHFRFNEFYDPEKYADVIDPAKAPKAEPDDIDEKLVNLLEALRERFVEKFDATAIIITPHGGYRPDPLNKLVGGASGSQHRYGRGADFRVKLRNGDYLDAATIAVWTEKWMDDLGYKGGVGVYDANHTYIHVDVRGKNVAWYDSYSSAGCPGQGGRPVTYRKGQKGAGVVLIQRYLKMNGPDGKYGKNTQAAVKKFQSEHGLTADGIFGKKTNEAMDHVLPW